MFRDWCPFNIGFLGVKLKFTQNSSNKFSTFAGVTKTHLYNGIIQGVFSFFGVVIQFKMHFYGRHLTKSQIL